MAPPPATPDRRALLADLLETGPQALHKTDALLQALDVLPVATPLHVLARVLRGILGGGTASRDGVHTLTRRIRSARSSMRRFWHAIEKFHPQMSAESELQPLEDLMSAFHKKRDDMLHQTGEIARLRGETAALRARVAAIFESLQQPG